MHLLSDSDLALPCENLRTAARPHRPAGRSRGADSEEITSVEPGEPSAAIRERVEAARAIQRERFRKCNAEMTTRQMRKHCELDPSSRRLLITAIERLGLSARAHDRILKVARTIADLGGCERVDSSHVAEAVQYRALDRAYFKS